MKDKKDAFLARTLETYADGLSPDDGRVRQAVAHAEARSKNLERIRYKKNRRLFTVLTPVLSVALILVVAFLSIGGYRMYAGLQTGGGSIVTYDYSKLYISRETILPQGYLSLEPLDGAARTRVYKMRENDERAFCVSKAELAGYGGYDIVYLIAECSDKRGAMFLKEYAPGDRLKKLYVEEKGEYYSRYSFIKEGVQYYLKVVSSHDYADTIFTAVTGMEI